MKNKYSINDSNYDLGELTITIYLAIIFVFLIFERRFLGHH